MISIMGPTCSGKTALSLALAKHLPIEIINVDSAQVYQDMDIGSAKPSATERAQVPHHLLDLCHPSEPYNAQRFVEDANQAIIEIKSRGKTPCLVGGSMLYFRALKYGFDPIPEADPSIRRQIEGEASEHGWPSIHQKLQSIDPISARRLAPHDKQRLARAYEVFLITGQPLSSLQTGNHAKQWGQCLEIALMPQQRSELAPSIEKRFDQMIAQGFEQEVKALFDNPLVTEALPAIKSVGYRQMWAYLSGEIDFISARAQAIQATKRLAKHQMTWLRRWHDAHFFTHSDPDLESQVCQLIKSDPNFLALLS